MSAPSRTAKKAHPALLVDELDEFLAALTALGIDITPQEPIAGARRAAVADPFGNRVELLPSPCVSLCRMNEARGLCQGCLRSIDEIIAWGRADEAYKRGVWLAIAERAKNAST
jgi:predicted Fe-S protein YdhL (DUF1289 family)